MRVAAVKMGRIDFGRSPAAMRCTKRVGTEMPVIPASAEMDVRAMRRGKRRGKLSSPAADARFSEPAARETWLYSIRGEGGRASGGVGVTGEAEGGWSSSSFQGWKESSGLLMGRQRENL